MSNDPNLQILVVDDYSTMVRIIKKLLKQIGFENVDDAASGEAALQKIKAKQYGLIIRDITGGNTNTSGYGMATWIPSLVVSTIVPGSAVVLELMTDAFQIFSG